MFKTDILLGEELDLLEDEHGNLVEGYSDMQHQQLLLACAKGAFKENPDTGAGIASYLEDDNDAELLAEITRQFAADGMNVRFVGFESGKLKIEANYGE